MQPTMRPGAHRRLAIVMALVNALMPPTKPPFVIPPEAMAHGPNQSPFRKKSGSQGRTKFDGRGWGKRHTKGFFRRKWIGGESLLFRP